MFIINPNLRWLYLLIMVICIDLLTFKIMAREYVYLAYRTGQSVDLTVIGNLVFAPSRDLVFSLSRDQRNKGHNGTNLLFRRLQYL